MRFNSPRDYNLMIRLNQEILNKVIDVNVIIFKLNAQESVTNVYGESTSKARYTPIQIPCLIDRSESAVLSDNGTVDVEQEVRFAFLRYELISRDIYPEIGDIVYYDRQFYEINNVPENQLYASQEHYNHQVMCIAHLTKKSALQIDEPLL